MKRHPSRLVPLLAVAALTLGACGSDDGSADDVPPTADDSSDEGLMAPRPIELGAGGGGTAMSADAESAPDRAIAPYPYRVTTFVAGDQLPALPTNDVGYAFEAGQSVTSEQVAQLAAALGVTGEPVAIEGDPAGSWRVGPDDGSAPSLWVYQDAQLSWNYNSAWADQTVSSGGCAVAGSAGAPEGDVAVVDAGEIAPDGSEIAPDDTVTAEVAVDPAVSEPACESPTPPEGVLSADEALARTRELMSAVGLDPEAFELEPYADEWFASVGATEQLDGTFAGRRFDAGFGANGVLQYASGQLAEPVRVGPYPLIDLETAIARLNDPSGYFGGGMIALDSGVARGAAEAGVGDGSAVVDMPEAEVDAGVPDTAPTEPAPIEPAPDTGSGVDPAVPPTDVSGELEPEQVTVTLVDVQSDVWWAWDVDGSVWLLPAYRFIGDDGGWYTVPAVTDEFLIQVPVDTIPVEPPPATEPAPVPETIPAVSVPGETTPPAPDGTVTDVAALEALIGTSLAEFTTEVEARGLTVRVVEQDGVSLPVTMDYLSDRVNVGVEGEGDAATVVRIVNLG
jgi:hypothetical protein